MYVCTVCMCCHLFFQMHCVHVNCFLQVRSRTNSDAFGSDGIDKSIDNDEESSGSDGDIVESGTEDETEGQSQSQREGEGERKTRVRSDESLDSESHRERLSAITISGSPERERYSSLEHDEDCDVTYETEDAHGIFRDAGTDEDEASVGYYPFAPVMKRNSLEGMGLGLPGGIVPRKWEHKDMNTDWKFVNSIAIPIIHKFTTRTNGSCISPRVPGVCWSYFGADPEWGEKQAAQLTVELETALVNYDVKIQAQNGNVEVLPRVMHKGKVVTEFLQKITEQRAGKLPSFVLVAGSDPADSDIFDSVYQQISECRPQDGIETCAAFSVHVGSVDNYSAGAFVPAVEDMQELLVALAASDSTDKSSVGQGCSMVIDGSVR
jgi:trehalose-phosphatase